MTLAVRRPTGWRRPDAQTLRILALLVVVVGIAGATGLPVLGDSPLLTTVSLPWWLLALGFAVTDAFVLNIRVRRETHTLTLSELPLVLGLFFAAPAALLAARLVSSIVSSALTRRSRPLKAAFNLCLGAMEVGVSLALFHLIASGSEVGPVSWVAAYAGALAADWLGALAVCTAIGIHEGRVDLAATLREAVLNPMPALATTTALITVTCLSASAASAPLLVVFAAMLLLGFRAYATLSERHLHLERLYRFSQAVGSEPETHDVLHTVLAQARDILHAERAVAAFRTPDGSTVTRFRIDADGRMTTSVDPFDPADGWLATQVYDQRRAVLLPYNSSDADAREWLASRGLLDAVVVPLSRGTGIAGSLSVGNRLGALRTFTQDDVLLLETMANHCSVALSNGELIGRLRHDALHDSLTGLPNRADLQRRLTEALAEITAGRAAGAAVMILDLDEFKAVNDTLGHHEGDRLLVEVAARLTTAVGNAGTVARLGGDEFAILVPGSSDEGRALRLARRALHALEEPIALEGHEVEVGGSIGIALAGPQSCDPAVLLKQADLAMYDAKTSTRGLRVYEPELDADSPRRLTLVSELRAALANGDVVVHVQPQAVLATGDVVRVEALVRWEHPELGWVSPDEFVPVAERSGLIRPLTTRVLDASLAACARWRAAGQDIGVAVNLSTRSLQDSDLLDDVERLLRRHGVPADRLTLEVTESSVMADPARAVALLHQVRALGVRLSLDDFGTGYSSLSYLQRLPVQEVKIDRSFVTGLGTEGENAAIVRAIVDLGRHLGLEVVAEGVEDQGTADVLTAMGCDLVQGWHLARAMPTDDLLPWLAGLRRHGSLRVV
ncbi:bifunctional diguanylate cyclase/phosphodiesterase [Blastococcus sp. TBT05-19]|uniref:putative bifunctional diguanylate cyclase/phosphodiesterase n=1 Tax=Blastococcus sp. TBT05-19 TaxID=2250581 RepID=UPI001314270E|nr:bifunctional diguanylate cyclase/phosphodiesterase [Blastococcus sp. TBT05-19]